MNIWDIKTPRSPLDRLLANIRYNNASFRITQGKQIVVRSK